MNQQTTTIESKMAGVTLDGVRKTYGGLEVIHGVDLEVISGEFLVLVGPSGCGKSTLLRMIAGLEEITDGLIRIGDRVVNDVPASQRNLSMVFQSYALYPHMSVRKNLAFGLTNLRMPRPEIERRVADAAKILQIGELMERKPRQLSGGQKQRVAIGRAIVREPQLFLFDEPLSNLDAELRVQMRVELANLYNRLGTTMIYVTHDQIEAMTMATRIVVLNGGNIEQVGTPYELYNFPRNRFVATFIGSPKMNMLEALLRRSRISDRCSLPAQRAARAASASACDRNRSRSARRATPRRRERSPWSSIWAAASSSMCASPPDRWCWCRRRARPSTRSATRSRWRSRPATPIISTRKVSVCR
jgi:multiple sugar transport system ATP-binding protein